MRMDRTEATNKNITMRAVREKSFINVSCNVDGHRTEAVKMGTYFTCTSLGVEKRVFNYIVSGIEQGKIL